MNPLHLNRLFPIFVLMSGLASCAPDKKTMDVYGDQPPTISGESLKEWSLHDSSKLDLNDTFDFSDSKPDRIRVTTVCSPDGHRAAEDFSFSGRSILTVFEIIPQSILLTPPNLTGQTRCDVTMDVSNRSQANRVFFIHSAALVDANRAAARLKTATGYYEDAELARVTPHTSDVQLEIAGPEPSRIHLACTDFETQDQSFNNSMALGLINLRKVNYRPHRPDGILKMHSYQLCRAFLTGENSQPAITNLFYLTFPLAPLQLAVAESPVTERSPGYAILRLQHKGEQQVLRVWNIFNPESIARTVRFSKSEKTVTIRNHAWHPLEPTEYYERTGDWVHFEPLDTQKESSASREFVREIPPLGTLKVQAIFTMGESSKCMNWVLLNTPSLQLEEVGPFDAAVAKFELGLPSRLNLSPFSLEVFDRATPGLCGVCAP